MILSRENFLLHLSPPRPSFLRCERGGDGELSMSLEFIFYSS